MTNDDKQVLKDRLKEIMLDLKDAMHKLEDAFELAHSEFCKLDKEEEE